MLLRIKLLVVSVVIASSAQAAIFIQYNNNTGVGSIAGGDPGAGDIVFGDRGYLWTWANNTQANEFTSIVNALVGTPAFLNGTPTNINGSTTIAPDSGILLNDVDTGPLTFTSPTPFTIAPGLWSSGENIYVASSASGGTAQQLTFSTIPEPSTYLAITTAVGLIGFAGYRRIRNKKQTQEAAAE